jgi:hypothetical protein
MNYSKGFFLLVSIAIRWPLAFSFLSPPVSTVKVGTLGAHPVSSVLPQSRRNKRKGIDNQQLRGAKNVTVTRVNNNRLETISIPDGVPQLTDVLKSITKEDFAPKKGDDGDSEANKKIKAPPVSTKQNGSRTREYHDDNKHLPQKGPNVQNILNNQNAERAHALVEKESHRKPQNATKILRQDEATASPWQASFRTSKQTQERIQQAGKATSGERSIKRAISVLKALLDTPSNQCNEANVVCALTLSAKVSEPDRRQNDEFRSLLARTLDVLHELVKEQRLNARQLCNAVWAVAKHYDRDQSLMPPPPQVAALSTDEKLGVAEAWILIDDNEHENLTKKRVDETVDEIARQLTTILVEEDEGKPPSQKSKVGELCMAGWAYGILRPRRRPPGWQLPPQMGQLNGVASGKPSSSRPSSFLTFEKWSSPEIDDDEGQQGTEVASLDVTDQLFDAIGESLCAPYNSSHPQSIVAATDVTQDHTRLESCSWSELANLAWAYASHGHCRSDSSERLLISLSQEAVRRLNLQEGQSDANNSFLTRDISQIVWALGNLQCDNFRLADGLVDLVNCLVAFYDIHEVDQSDFGPTSRPFHNWSCPDLVQLTISLAHARIDDLPLLRVLFGEAHQRLLRGIEVTANERHQEKRLGAFRAWEVSVLLWAQARLYLTSSQGQVFEDFAVQAPRALVMATKSVGADLGHIGIGPQEQANVAWSLTVLQQHQSSEAVEVLSNIFREAARFSQVQRMIQLEHAHQLWQALFMLEEESPTAVQGVPPWFRHYLKQKWLVEKARQKRSSARHRSLSQTLHFMGVSHLNEHDEDIDVAIVLKPDASWTYQAVRLAAASTGGRRFDGFRNVAAPVKVAVEFDGPNHFARETARLPKGGPSNSNDKPPPPRALGHTVLKYRLLKKQGWTVVRVPYYEFDKIPFWASMVSV